MTAGNYIHKKRFTEEELKEHQKIRHKEWVEKNRKKVNKYQGEWCKNHRESRNKTNKKWKEKKNE